MRTRISKTPSDRSKNWTHVVEAGVCVRPPGMKLDLLLNLRYDFESPQNELHTLAGLVFLAVEWNEGGMGQNVRAILRSNGDYMGGSKP